MQNWDKYSGSKELTLTGMKHGMQLITNHAFICVWTDEIGDDTKVSALRAEVKSLKASTQSEIFIMAVTTGAVPDDRRPR
mgnify:CR=1 FL=1